MLTQGCQTMTNLGGVPWLWESSVSSPLVSPSPLCVVCPPPSSPAAYDSYYTGTQSAAALQYSSARGRGHVRRCSLHLASYTTHIQYSRGLNRIPFLHYFLLIFLFQNNIKHSSALICVEFPKAMKKENVRTIKLLTSGLGKIVTD